MPSAVQSLLLVAPDGDALATDVRQRFRQLDVTVAASDTAARAYLGASAFDLVVVAASMPGETAQTMTGLIEALGRSSTVIADAPSDGLAEWLRGHVAPAADEARAAPPPRAEGDDALATVSEELSRIAHALNNPLAVIDGNAQLALELARALGVDASVVSAIEDIQGGSQSLAALFSDLAALRERVDAIRQR